MSYADIGIVGLGVMGQSLALNLADKGHTVATTDGWAEARQDFRSKLLSGQDISVVDAVPELVSALARPRTILLMIKAGEPVDRQIEEFLGLLEPGDLVIDGGNSHYQHSERRNKALESQSLQFLAAGISGGEAGARSGPSIMVGGSPDGYARVEGLLHDISAKVDGTPCCAYLGSGGAGHFVKMVHNGIEYADMQLIAEAYMILKSHVRLSHEEMAALFARWNEGDLRSYLVKITARILTKNDPESGGPLVEVILDQAGQKGTGQWASAAALELGVPAPTIAAAVFARAISAIKDQRVQAETVLPGSVAADPMSDGPALVKALGEALLCSRICAYAQGFALLKVAAEEFDWSTDLGQVARIWRGGCIIRAGILETIDGAYRDDPKLRNLLLAPGFQGALARCQDGWRWIIEAALAHGLPVPGMASALAYYDAYRSGWLPANLIQAQRDYFGAHGYKRVDLPGTFHTNWQDE